MKTAKNFLFILALAVAFCFTIMIANSNRVFADDAVELEILQKVKKIKKLINQDVIPILNGDCPPCPPSTIEAEVPRTGQTLCYNTDGDVVDCAGTGQDGDLQKGIPFPMPRFTDNLDGTVTDNMTGLIWLKDANCFERRTWTDALSDCDGLADGSCGLIDGSSAGEWRLPNVRELHSLIDFGNEDPALPSGHPFSNPISLGHWSSTTYVFNNSTDFAWNVHMSNGFMSSGIKVNKYFVWPVRDGN